GRLFVFREERSLLQIEAIKVHHLHPCFHEVLNELLPSIVLRVHFSERKQLSIMSDDQIETRTAPHHFADLAIAAFVETGLAVRERLPNSAHDQKIHEEIIGELAGTLGEHAVFRAAGVGAEHAQSAYEHGHLGSAQGEQLRLVHEHELGTCHR